MWQVSYLWEEIPWLQQCLTSSQTSCSCTLQTRLKMLQAVSQLQVFQRPISTTNSVIHADHELIAWCSDVKVLNSSVIFTDVCHRGCWGPRTLVRCILSQSKTSMGTLCWCSWRTWTPVPTWMAFAGRSCANSSSNASPSRPRRSPLPWTFCSLNSMWVLRWLKVCPSRKEWFCAVHFLFPPQLGMDGGICQRHSWVYFSSFSFLKCFSNPELRRKSIERHFQNVSRSPGKHLFIGISLMSLNTHSQRMSEDKAETIRLQIEMCFLLQLLHVQTLIIQASVNYHDSPLPLLGTFSQESYWSDVGSVCKTASTSREY